MSTLGTGSPVPHAAVVREQARLEAVRSLRLLEDPVGSGIADVVQLAADVCGVPTAVINIFDQDMVYPLAALDAALRPTPRDQAMCELAVQTDTELITADARLEPRLADNPFVAAPDGQIRFYASIPLTTAAGHTVGALCTYDLVPRELSAGQVKLLRALAKQATGIFELREALARSAATSQALAVLNQQADEVLETSMDAYYSIDTEGVVQTWNRAAVALFGYTTEEAVGHDLTTLVIPAAFRAGFLSRIRAEGMEAGGIRRVNAHGKNGVLLTLDLTVWPSRSQARWHIFARDVTERIATDRQRAAVEERWRVAFEAAPLGIVVNDLTDPAAPMLLSSNSKFSEMLGRPPEEVRRLGTAGLTHPDDLARDVVAAGRLMAGQLDVYRTDKRYLHAEGHVVWARLTASLARTDTAAYMISQVEDITASRAAERARQQAESLLTIAFEHAPHGTTIIGIRGAQRGRLLRVNPALIAMTRRENLVSVRLSTLLDDDGTDVLTEFERLADGEQELFERVCRLRAGGGYIFVQASITLSRDLDGRPEHALAQVRDITQQHAHEEYLTRHAKTDTLTGLANRLAMRERLVQEIDALRSGQGALGVMMIDLDRFKAVNDTLGHEAGDDLLLRVAEALVQTLPPDALASRLGGDEFIVIVPGQDAARMARLVDRITKAVDQAGTELDERVGCCVTGSVGYTLTQNPATAPEDLIRAADQAMYLTKRSRRPALTSPPAELTDAVASAGKPG